jgi:nicotinate-nucleotide adenylyltransferase
MMHYRGIFGGTFDPFHAGHLALALYSVEQLGLDTLAIMPCHIPPHRQQPGVTSEHRAAMVQLAIAPYPALYLESLELERNTASYSVDSLSLLKQKYPQDTLLFFIGMDSLQNFTRWHRWQDILQLANLVVWQRPGYDAQTASCQQLLLDYPSAAPATVAATSNPARYFSKAAGQILLLDNPQYDISATQIRADQRLQQLPAVAAYIAKHQLYRSSHI